MLYLCIVKIDGDIESNKTFYNNTKTKQKQLWHLKLKHKRKCRRLAPTLASTAM